MAKDIYQSDHRRSLMDRSTRLISEGLGASISSAMRSPPPVRSDVIVMSKGQPQTLSFQGTLPPLAAFEVTFAAISGPFFLQ